MGLNCGCPAGAHLADLSIPDCKESLGQIQKVIFQRIKQADGTKNTIANPAVKASWTALMSASNGTKCIISPYIQGPTTEPGAARTWGGGNDSLGGMTIVIGAEPTTFSGNIYQESQSVIKVLKTYMCENIGVYLIDENGRSAVSPTVRPARPRTPRFPFSRSSWATRTSAASMLLTETPFPGASLRTGATTS